MIEYILLGIIQGVLEWLPVSSEAFLVIFSQIFSVNINFIDIALFLHLGTLLAVVTFFYRDWINILLLRDMEMFRFIFYATTASLFSGVPIYLLIRRTAVGPYILFIIGLGFLITTALNMKISQEENIAISQTKLALLTGFLQGIAVIPGISRSAITMFSLSMGRLKPQDILKLSYLISVPVVILSTIYLTINNPIVLNAWPALPTAYITGLATLKTLLTIAKKLKTYILTLILAILTLLGALAIIIFP